MERFLVLTTSAETAESDNPPKEKHQLRHRQPVSALYAEHLQTLKERFERYFPRVADIEDNDRDPFNQESESSTEKLTMKEREESAELRADRTLKLKFRLKTLTRVAMAERTSSGPLMEPPPAAAAVALPAAAVTLPAEVRERLAELELELSEVSSASLHFTVYCHTFGGLSDPFVRVTETELAYHSSTTSMLQHLNRKHPFYSADRRP
ncbi:unnamed protein product [Gadus morhua 'NCC']